MPVDHYENFPVASILLPRRLVPAVEAIYAFARSADDIADEGDALPAERLAALAAYDAALDAIAPATRRRPDVRAPGRALRRHALPLQPLRDLLSAFRQDVVTTRYPDYPTLLDYCRRSANPVGRLMLGLYGAVDEQPARIGRHLLRPPADQLLAGRRHRHRQGPHLPAAGRPGALRRERGRHLRRRRHPAWRALMRFEVERARA
jgi:phytoene/squalene synthetase